MRLLEIVTLDHREGFRWRSRQLGSKLRCVVWAVETRRRTDHLKALDGNVQAIPQATQQQADFRATRTAVQVRLVEDQQKLLIGIGGQPRLRLVEDRSLN